MEDLLVSLQLLLCPGIYKEVNRWEHSLETSIKCQSSHVIFLFICLSNQKVKLLEYVHFNPFTISFIFSLQSAKLPLHSSLLRKTTLRQESVTISREILVCSGPHLLVCVHNNSFSLEIVKKSDRLSKLSIKPGYVSVRIQKP